MQSERFASTADQHACRAMIRHGSKSFFAASLLLPSRVRDGAYALYAFCRLSDDVVDVEGGRAGAVARLSARLDAAYAGAPAASPIDRALSDTVRAFDIPKALLAALLEGLTWDVEQRRYETFDALTAYAARVAGAVGAMMTALMGARGPALAARACDLGVAMQLTNIARDVGEDAQAGRVYLPLAWLREAGIDPDAFLAAPAPSAALASVVRRLLDEADALYRRADAGIAALPADCRAAIFAARMIYSEIGAEVRRADYDSVSSRARVAGARKLVLAIRACARARLGRPDPRLLAAPALPQTRGLADAVSRLDVRVRRASLSPWAWVDENWGWVWELFNRMGQRERPSRHM